MAASCACGRTGYACPTGKRVSARWWSTPAAWAFWPAGKREPGEDPFVTAQRELKEEIGAAAEAWTDLGALIASPGCYGETLYLFLACELTFGETHPDADEFLETVRVPFDEAVELCMSGELTDAKTVAAILKAKVLLGR